MNDDNDYMNISSQTLFNVLDTLVYSALKGMIDSCDYVQHCVSGLINYQFQHKKRRISNELGWAEAITECIKFLQAPSIETYKKISMDRGYTLCILEEFLAITQDSKPLFLSYMRKKDPVVKEKICKIQHRIGLKSGNLLQLVSETTYLRNTINEHRARMLDAYDLYRKKCAQRDAKSIPLQIDISDLIQNYYMAGCKAIDHYDVHKGAFKSYLDIWMKKSLHSGNHFYGSAYSVPGGVKANHLSVNIDSIAERCGVDLEDSLIESEKHNDIRRIIRMIDPEGLCEEYATETIM